MAKHRPGKANQKLYFASFHLNAIAELDGNDTLVHRKALYQSLKEAFLFQLYGAFEAILWEIGNTYGVAMEPNLGAQGLHRRCLDKGATSPEIERLAEMSVNKHSWLNAFLDDWQKACALDPHEGATVVAPANLNAIEIRRLDSEENTDQLNQWHNEMKQLLSEMRSILAEW